MSAKKKMSPFGHGVRGSLNVITGNSTLAGAAQKIMKDLGQNKKKKKK